MRSRTRNLGLASVVLGGAVLSGLSGCLLNPNNYPGQEKEVQAYNIKQVITGGLFAATPYAKTLPQVAVMNATAQTMNSNNIVRAREFQENSGNYTENNSDPKNQENVDSRRPTDRRLSHLEFIETLRTQNVSSERIALAKLGNVAYDPMFGQTFSLICNYGKDLNNNGEIEGPEELFGIGSQFIEGGPILIGMGCERDSNIGEAIYELFDSRGNKIDELRKPSSTEICPDSKELYTSVNIAYNHTELLKYPERGEPVRREVKLSSGRYLATLHSGTNLITSREFNIVPKQ